jgi:predicted ABC-type ATPase
MSAISPQERARIRTALYDGLQAVDAPCVHAMAGIPGAGKTTFVARAQASGLFPATAFMLNPDVVMDMLAPYRDDCATLGAQAAFERWEMPARMLTYDLARGAAAKKFPIIKDMGMVRAENWDMLADFKGQGYRIEMHAIHCTVSVALRSCAARERHFPESQVMERVAALETLFSQYASVPNSVFWYERADHDFVRIK